MKILYDGIKEDMESFGLLQENAPVGKGRRLRGHPVTQAT